MNEAAEPIRTRRRARAEATAARVRAAAAELFARNPYDAVSVSTIANSAGCAHGLVFHYFSNKRGLYLAAMRDVADQLTAAHDTAKGPDARAELRAMFAAHFAFMQRRATLARALLRGGIGVDTEAWAIFEGVRQSFLARVCVLLQLDPENRVLAFMLRSFAGTIDEATIQLLDQPDIVEVEPLIDAMIDMLVAAIRAASTLDSAIEIDAVIAALRDEPRNVL